MKSKFLLFTFIVLTAIACKKETNETSEESTSKYSSSASYTLTDVSYGSDDKQKMDIYLPANRSSITTKVFVLVHGGGWSSGSKSSLSSTLNNLKDTYPNYAIINLNYRLGTFYNPGFPKQIEDIKSAINEIQKEEYNLSKAYFFYGISAGAHLSMLYSYSFDPDNEVKAVCNVVGPSDLTDSAYEGTFTKSSIFPSLVGGATLEQNPQLFEEVSPALQITSNAPPTISFYGGSDTLVPSSQMNLLHNQLSNHGIPNEPTLYPTKTHVSWTQAEINDFVTKFAQFVTNYF